MRRTRCRGIPRPSWRCSFARSAVGSALRSVLGSRHEPRNRPIPHRSGDRGPAFCRHTYVTQGSVHEGRRSLDPRPMLAIFALLVIAALVERRVEHPPRSRARLRGLARALRSRRHRYRLRAGSTALPRHAPHAGARTTVAVVPADEFDPQARDGAALRRRAGAQRPQPARLARPPRPRAAGAADQRPQRPPRLPARSPRPLARAAAHGAARLRGSRAARSRRGAARAAGAGRSGCAPSWSSPAPSIEPLAQLALDPDPLAALRRGDGLAAGRSTASGSASASTCCRPPDCAALACGPS